MSGERMDSKFVDRDETQERGKSLLNFLASRTWDQPDGIEISGGALANQTAIKNRTARVINITTRYENGVPILIHGYFKAPENFGNGDDFYITGKALEEYLKKPIDHAS